MLTTERLEKAGFLCVILIFSALFVKLTFIANLLIFVFIFICIVSNIHRYQEEQKLAKWKIESEKTNQERLLQKQHEEEQRKLEQEQRKLEEKKQKEEEKIAAKRLAEAQSAEASARRIYQQEIKKQNAIVELEVNAKNLLIVRPLKMSKLDFAKVSKIEFLRFSERICQEANDYYIIQSDDDGIWKNLSFNAFISYVRHNYTNYEFLLLDIRNHTIAYSILKPRVNKLIISILTLIDINMSEPESFFIRKMNKESIDSWNWDVQTKENLKSRYAKF